MYFEYHKQDMMIIYFLLIDIYNHNFDILICNFFHYYSC